MPQPAPTARSRLAGGLVAALCAAAPAWAQATSEAGDLLQRIDQLARDSARQATSPTARVEVEVGTLDPRLKLAPCRRIESYLPPGLPAWGRTRVGMRCVEGEKRWNVTLPVTVHVFIRALVLSSAGSAGQTLAAPQLTEAEVDLASGSSMPLLRPEALVGRVLARPLAAGSPVRASDLKARQWFAAGDNVRIVAVGPGWRIASEGQAITPGIEGQTARVRTDSGRLVQGRPVADRELEVML
ncbi:flagellar basal body P-ring formation protein FlgA [Ideonella sp. 4Y16]|uniref:Flagella basal body P-ring formation protein FlgA n=1 Tax=Ideonella alba TaxID=2824118 RepID=A0A940Y7Q7_9BURK|nr:flagellar basal body P-ring formation chaperone FlgA [Ideonella alba]MBQ0929770.1 flagellar basal body P-ring formation protein FlgA [Ideonella alba]MBQ0942010.1 flagellar basal body P-ring formation protein FlgA [Ideonella alba]